MDQLHVLRERLSMVAVMLLLGNLMVVLQTAEAQIGVCHGMLGDDLPIPSEVVALYTQKGIKRMRIYYPDRATLQALKGSAIEVMLGVPNADLQTLASSQAEAAKWIQTNVRSYSDVKFRYIAVGNEVDPSNGGQFLLAALKNVQNAVDAAALGDRIRVSTAVSAGLLGTSYPPSRGAFRPEISSFISPIVSFLVKNRSPLLVNLYPYFSYTSNSRMVDLDYALFNAPSVMVQDGQIGYKNLFDTMVDAFYMAVEKAAGGNASLEIVVSETGWPSAGGIAATVENAMIYNGNLIQHVDGGTPRRPGKPVETYIFAMFDQNQLISLQDWGIFLPNKKPKYPIIFTKFKYLLLQCR